MEPDYYEVLGVGCEAAREEIKASYRLAVRQHHPDASPAEAKDAAHAKIQLINAAWTTLGDAVARAAYDERRRRAMAQAPLTAASGGASSLHAPPGARAGGHAPRPGAATPVDGRKRSRVQAVMGGSSSPRPVNPRTRLLAMVFDAAQLYHVEGRAEEAARVCQNVLRADPTSAEAAVLLADIYAAQNQRAAALDLLERALRLQPSNALYRSKWEALRHAASADTRSSSSGPAPPPAARASAPNPWGKPGAHSPLASRISERAPEAPQVLEPAAVPQPPAPSGFPQAEPGSHLPHDLPHDPAPEEAPAATLAAGREDQAELSSGLPESPRSSILQRLRSRLAR